MAPLAFVLQAEELGEELRTASWSREGTMVWSSPIGIE